MYKNFIEMLGNTLAVMLFTLFIWVFAIFLYYVLIRKIRNSYIKKFTLAIDALVESDKYTLSILFSFATADFLVNKYNSLYFFMAYLIFWIIVFIMIVRNYNKRISKKQSISPEQIEDMSIDLGDMNIDIGDTEDVEDMSIDLDSDKEITMRTLRILITTIRSLPFILGIYLFQYIKHWYFIVPFVYIMYINFLSISNIINWNDKELLKAGVSLRESLSVNTKTSLIIIIIGLIIWHINS